MRQRLITWAFALAVLPKISTTEVSIPGHSIDRAETSIEAAGLGTKVSESTESKGNFNSHLWKDENQELWRTLSGLGTRAASNPTAYAGGFIPLTPLSTAEESVGPTAKETMTYSEGLVYKVAFNLVFPALFDTLKGSTASTDHESLEKLQKLILDDLHLRDPVYDDSGYGKSWKPIMNHVMTRLAGDQLRRQFIAFKKAQLKDNQKFEEPETLSFERFLQWQGFGTSGNAYRAYMFFVERAEKLLAIGLKDVREAIRKGNDETTTDRIDGEVGMLRDELIYNEVILDQETQSPFQDLEGEDIESLKEAIWKNGYLASQENIKRWLKIQEISKKNDLKDPKIPENIDGSARTILQEIYRTAIREGSNSNPILNRITQLLVFPLQDPSLLPAEDTRFKEVYLAMIEGLCVKRNEQLDSFETQIRNLVFFFILADLFSKILFETEKLPVDKTHFRYLHYYWTSVKRGHVMTLKGGRGNISVPNGMNFQLGQSYHLYLGCAYHIQQMAEQIEADHSETIKNLQSVLSKGILLPYKRTQNRIVDIWAHPTPSTTSSLAHIPDLSSVGRDNEGHEPPEPPINRQDPSGALPKSDSRVTNIPPINRQTNNWSVDSVPVTGAVFPPSRHPDKALSTIILDKTSPNAAGTNPLLSFPEVDAARYFGPWLGKELTRHKEYQDFLDAIASSQNSRILESISHPAIGANSQHRSPFSQVPTEEQRENAQKLRDLLRKSRTRLREQPVHLQQIATVWPSDRSSASIHHSLPVNPSSSTQTLRTLQSISHPAIGANSHHRSLMRVQQLDSEPRSGGQSSAYQSINVNGIPREILSTGELLKRKSSRKDPEIPPPKKVMLFGKAIGVTHNNRD
ncbi:hypothetical protein CROQUDRAFT_719070 [Cronartium quercuum f. sp. fusiforme G11]|uniref:Secreted protein n=1 Tax=Cronartium quercuum f. sp. fusiforme G11 TaxID=708437 RepID=A0A9P6N527_9BASI|nr:hypothetical protein CROQUDRAFT_719070 [Cronartium quercuum f. sp. fusiforme G11]